MTIREPHERVGARRGVQGDESLEFVDGSFRFARHEITLAQCCVQVRPLWSNFQTGFEQRDRIFKVVLTSC